MLAKLQSEAEPENNLPDERMTHWGNEKLTIRLGVSLDEALAFLFVGVLFAALAFAISSEGDGGSSLFSECYIEECSHTPDSGLFAK